MYFFYFIFWCEKPPPSHRLGAVLYTKSRPPPPPPPKASPQLRSASHRPVLKRILVPPPQIISSRSLSPTFRTTNHSTLGQTSFGHSTLIDSFVPSLACSPIPRARRRLAPPRPRLHPPEHYSIATRGWQGVQDPENKTGGHRLMHSTAQHSPSSTEHGHLL